MIKLLLNKTNKKILKVQQKNNILKIKEDNINNDLKKIIFINDNNIELYIPSDFKDINNISYKWFPIFNYVRDNEMKTRLLVNDLITNNLIDNKKNIIDSGAFIGDNSLPWAKNINGTVYAIDPSINNKNLITYLANINKINNIIFYQEVLADSIKKISYNGDLDFNTFINNEGANEIITTSLDELYKNGKINNIDFIHLDVEGLEYEVFLGSIELINKYNPIIIFEQHIISDIDINNILDLLKNLNYIIYLIDEQTGSRKDCRNLLAIPINKHESFLTKCKFLSFCIEISELENEKIKLL